MYDEPTKAIVGPFDRAGKWRQVGADLMVADLCRRRRKDTRSDKTGYRHPEKEDAADDEDVHCLGNKDDNGGQDGRADNSIE